MCLFRKDGMKVDKCMALAEKDREIHKKLDQYILT